MTKRLYLIQFFNSFPVPLIGAASIMLLINRWDVSNLWMSLFIVVPTLCQVFQPLIAPWIEYIGYRDFYMRGRSIKLGILLTFLVFIYFSESILMPYRLYICYFLYILLCLAAALTTASWNPLQRSLVSEEKRPGYISRDLMINQFSCLIGFLVAAYFLKGKSIQEFIVLFTLGFFSFLTCVALVSQLPKSERLTKDVIHNLKFGQIIQNKTLRWILFISFWVYLGFIGGPQFNMPMLISNFSFTDSEILIFTACAFFLVGVISYLLGKVADRFDHMTFLLFGCFMLGFHFFCWGLIGSYIIPFDLWGMALAQLTWAIGCPLYMIGINRWMMKDLPKENYSRYTTIQTAMMGAIYLFNPGWGVLIDYLKENPIIINGWIWNHYGFAYIISSLSYVVPTVVLLYLRFSKKSLYDSKITHN
jgi:MFS family permease